MLTAFWGRVEGANIIFPREDDMMDSSVAALVTVFHQCTSDKHAKVCAPGDTVRVRDTMPKGSGDVVWELHLLPAEMTPVDGDDHSFEVSWDTAVRRPFQVYTR